MMISQHYGVKIPSGEMLAVEDYGGWHGILLSGYGTR